MAKIHTDLSGMTFGRWLVLGPSERRSRDRHRLWHCRCECGTEREIVGRDMLAGDSRSCGCLKSETCAARMARMNRQTVGRIAPTRTHGLTHTPTWHCWRSMRDRCYNPRQTGFRDYGGRGIRVCDRWRSSFQAFLDDMGVRPSPRHSLGRIDNDGDYTPENCRWETVAQQMRNRRNTVRVQFRGEERPLGEWCEMMGLKYRLAYERIFRQGWDVERALTHHLCASSRE